MQWSKLDEGLRNALGADPAWLLQRDGAKFSVFVTTEHDQTYSGEFSATGLADLSSQTWVKSIRLSGQRRHT